MKAIERIKAIGEKASDVEYKEQQGTDGFDRLLNLEDKVVTIEESGIENKHGVNYLMAEVASLNAMVVELANIIDETHVPSNENRINDLTKAYWTKIDDMQEQINKCTKN